MKYKFKPLMLGSAIAVSAALSGCGSDQEQPEITDVFKEVGLWCKSPEIVQIASPDSYPLSAQEVADIEAAIDVAKAEDLAEADPDGNWTDEEIAAWEAEWEANFKLTDLDLYAILGLTLEEQERQAVAKEEARAFQIEQGQDVIRGDDFDAWFDAWFAEIPPASYLGNSQRINRSVNATTPEMDGEEICYTPPLSCPNYKAIDETGTYECIIPEMNPIPDAPAPAYIASTGEAVAYYRHEEHVEGADNSALYENMVVHTWNNDDCTAYADDSIAPQWGISGADQAGIDDNYGVYWVLNLVDEPSTCANIIFNDTAAGKKISDTDLIMPVGPSGDVTLHNVDKNAYADDNFPANALDGLLIINQHPFFGAEASSGLKSCGWSQEADESGEQCIGQELICPDDSVAVGVGAIDIPSKCVAVFDPESTDLLLRGGFNGWGDAEDPNFDASQLDYVGDGQYRTIFPYTTDCEIVEPVEATEDTPAVEGEDCVSTYDFKVADLDWSEPSTFGSIKGGDQSAVGTTILMTVGEGVGQNMKVDMGKDKAYQFLVNAADPSAVELTINEVPVETYPTITIGDNTVDLDYKANGQYVSEQALATGSTYSISVADFGATMGAPADNILVGDTAVTLVTDGSAFSFTPEREGNHIFVLDLSDIAAPTIKVETPKPFGKESLFIRGTVTGWGDPAPNEDEMVWNPEDRTYSVIYGLEKDGDHNFKFASQAWGGALDVGGSAFTFSADGEDLSGDGNILVKPAKSTSYKFSISYATADPVLKVEEAPLYLRGGVTATGWDAADGNQLMFMPEDEGNPSEASHVYSLEVAYAGGRSEFKVADTGWGGTLGYNYGVEVEGTEIALDETLNLTNNGNNIIIDVPAGTYIFAFEDGVTKTMTVTAK